MCDLIIIIASSVSLHQAEAANPFSISTTIILRTQNLQLLSLQGSGEMFICAEDCIYYFLIS